MKIIDVKPTLGINSFLYELITSDGKFYVTILFGDRESNLVITIEKKLFDTSNHKKDIINPIEFSYLLKNSIYDNEIINTIINIIDDIHLSEHRNTEINKLI